MDEYLCSLKLSFPNNAVYILNTTDLKLRAYKNSDETDGRRGRQTRKRKGENRSWEVDDFYDGFSCLYNEVSPMEVEVSGPRVVNGPVQAQVIPCPPLQPPLS